MEKESRKWLANFVRYSGDWSWNKEHNNWSSTLGSYPGDWGEPIACVKWNILSEEENGISMGNVSNR